MRVETAMSRISLTEEQMSRIAEGLGAQPDIQEMLRALAGLRVIFSDMLTHRRGIEPETRARLFWAGIIGTLQLDHLATLQHWRRTMEEVEQPPWIQNANSATHDRSSYVLWTGIMELCCDGEVRAGHYAQSSAVIQTARTAVAVKRYQLKHGKLPDQLSELSPVFLESPPIDPCDGQPLRMLVTDQTITIYSVGKDQTDDGGVKTNNFDERFRPGSDIPFTIPR